VLLSRGIVAKSGPTSEVISYYVSQRGSTGSAGDLRNFPDREGTGRARIVGLELLAEGGGVADVAEFGSSFGVRLHYEAYARIPSPHFGIAILDESNERVFLSNTEEGGVALEVLEGNGTLDCMLDRPNLLPGI
jgi:hypothetical protein